MDLASSLTVIGWFVQVLLDQGITFAIDHWGGAGAGPDLPAALERLREAINNVRALLPIAEKIRSGNEGLLESVKDLKDAAYDAEDILSELDYYRLQEEAEGNDNSNNSSFGSSMIEAAGGFLSQLLLTNEDTQASTSSSPPSVFDNKVTIIPRIYEVVARLDRIIAGVSRVLALLKPEEDLDADSHGFTSYRVTTSFVSSKQIMFGREDTKAHIIELLLNGPPAAASDVCVLPIIGAGGIGKTTLARVIYNDKRVVEHFDCRLWLYVSDNFDVPRLTREMLESLGIQGSSQMKSLDKLQALLMENLCSKKFLLVMDDVWNDVDSQKWKTLCGPLEFGKTGSRILLTTRLDTVVRMVGEEAINVFGCSVKLKGLPKDEYLSLFNKCAFGDEEPSDHSNLAEIGKQIAGKLDGSPLAAKTVGSLLRENLDVEHWRSILSSDIWKLPQRQDDIMPVLKLSYQHLPVHLQQCFAYCCVFPKGWDLDEHELVKMWIAHGYIDAITRENKRMEDIGREYSKILLARSFLEEANGYFFVVHDLFHDLARSVSADESFIIDTNNQKVPRRVRHLSLSSDHITLILQKSYLRNLRTLIVRGVITNYHVLEVAEEVFEGIRPPAYIKKLFIDGYGGVNTPSWMIHEIRCFSNLESLYLVNCLKWKELPPLGELPFLRHLTIYKADAVEVIGRGFYGTGDAKGFPLLKTLEFVCMPQLVTWLGIGEDSSFLFPRLYKLVIAGCPKLEQVPTMKDLTSLKKVSLSFCNRLHSLPLLPAMLEVLELECLELLTDLTMEQEEKLSDLTSLRELYIKQCPRLNSLPLLPVSLKILEVHCCLRLTSLPLLPTSLEMLFVRKLLLEDLPSLPTSLRQLHILRCRHLNSLPLLPVSLEKLLVNECPKLPRERYQEGGEDWNNVAHISEIEWYQEASREDRYNKWYQAQVWAVAADPDSDQENADTVNTREREWEWMWDKDLGVD